MLAILMQHLHPNVIKRVREQAMTRFATIGDKYVIDEAKEFFAVALNER